MVDPLDIDYGIFDIKVAIIRHLSCILPDRIFADRLPPADSFLTNQQYSVVVSDITDNTVAENCDGRFGRNILQLTVYERIDCDRFNDPAGLLAALVGGLIRHARKAEGLFFNGLRIETVNMQSRNQLPYVGDDIKAIAVTLAIDYIIGE